MKRFYLLALLMLLILPNAFSQLQFGVKGGIVTSSSTLDKTLTEDQLKGANVDYNQLKLEATDAQVGFQAGLFGRLSLAALYVQPELMFTSTSSKVKVSKLIDSESPDPEIKNQEFKKIDIPIMVGWKFGPARLQAGPVGSIMLDKKSAIEAATEFKEEFNGATWGYQVGLGLDLFNTLTLDAKYEGSLSKLGEGVEIGENTYTIDNRPNQFIVTVGLFF
jgi:hypothetical protein